MSKITTGVSEGINNTIKAPKRRPFCFRNMEYFTLKIMQVTGLD
jgi:transposase